MRLQPTGKFDNAAKAYRHIRVAPLAAAMGAEVSGIDMGDLSDAAFAEIRDALWRHKMLCFRDQTIGNAEQEGFTLRFGAFGADAYTKGVDGHPNVQPVIKEAETQVKMIFGEGWHTDSPFLERPPSVAVLRCTEAPPWGADTIWCNTELAWDYLSDTMKAALAPLRVRMSARDVIANMDAQQVAEGGGPRLGNVEMSVERAGMIEGRAHPLVRTHPETGRKALYVDETYSVAIEGMTQAESDALLGFLRAHVTQPSFTCRLRWRAGTVAMWDNRGTIHHAFNDHDGFRREMYRTTVMGEAPA
jgi:alpha-ketoglutarate-dependent taurine dioxygenase